MQYQFYRYINLILTFYCA